MFATVFMFIIILLFFDPVYSVVVMPFIVLLGARPGRFTSSVLAGKACVFLGRISFSLYMVHYPIVRACQFVQSKHLARLPNALYTAVAIISALFLATLICIHIEEPLRRFGRNSTGKITRRLTIA